MSKSEAHIGLLPNGFIDLLPGQADQEAGAISSLMRLFYGFGYDRVKPPLVEFEDSLLAPGPGAAMSQDTFRLMDPVSHRMMGVRSDITAQIARIASSRLKGVERPLRLSYTNDVLRTQSGQNRIERQFCQTGCEIIGDEGIHSFVEVAVLSVLGLHQIGIKAITLDLAMPKIVDQFMEQSDIPQENQGEVLEKIAIRDRNALDDFDQKYGSHFSDLVVLNGKAQDVIARLHNLDLPGDAKDDLDSMTEILHAIDNALKQLGLGDVSITLDPCEQRGFEYHNKFAFSLFSQDAKSELGRGGQYQVLFSGNENAEMANGFTLYMDVVRKALGDDDIKGCEMVEKSRDWSELLAKASQGKRIKRNLS